MTALALSLAYAGFTCLCLSMRRHHRQVWTGDASAAKLLGFRLAGWLCLVLSLSVCIGVWGWAVGLVVWFGVLTFVGSVLVFLLPYAPRTAAILAIVASALAAFVFASP